MILIQQNDEEQGITNQKIRITKKNNIDLCQKK